MIKKGSLLFLILLIFIFVQCVVKKENDKAVTIYEKSEDAIVIENDSLSYKIIIFEPGFNSWLGSVARPRNYYGQSFLEQRNRVWVQEYNMRVNQPFVYQPALYPFAIEYNSSIDYGYEVNYLLYNYFIFFQNHYNQKLGYFIPRI